MPRGPRSRGFSLVEMLVALLFVGILMAGMASIMRSSVGNISASGEGISALRRNRVSMDLLADDLNLAGLVISTLPDPPVLGQDRPGFYILPNMPIPGTGADDPANADQVFFYMDEPLPFEGTLKSTSTPPKTKDELVLGGASPDGTDSTFRIDCHSPSYAGLVKPGMGAVFKDGWEVFYIASVDTPSGGSVTIHTGPDPNAGITGRGSVLGNANKAHRAGTDVLFFRPAQVVRYSIKMKLLDPQKASGVPCLIRDQGNYDPIGFSADATQEATVSENVSGFKAYLSADAGQSWAGYGKSYSEFSAGWTNGIQAELNTQLQTAGRADYLSTSGDPNWYRSAPVLVRLDITTRSATQRTENARQPADQITPVAAVYKEYTQSLIMVPRHFGLPFR